MTDVESHSGGYFPREAERDLLDDTKCPPGSLLANFVGVAQVLLPNGSFRIVRVYPCGTVNGSLERGMLADALDDSIADRGRQRRVS